MRTITVVDESGLFRESFQDEKGLQFNYIDASLADAKANLKESGSFGLLYIPDIQIDNPSGITFYSESSAGMEFKGRIERILQQRIEGLKLEKSQIDKATLDALRTKISLNEVSLAGGEEKSANTGLYTGIGYAGSYLIFIFIFMYGAQIMRGVLEEKSNRIIEVIISSVKPMQLMVGKTIGIAAVGFTQFLIWILLTFALYSVGLSAIDLDAETISQINQMPAGGEEEFSQAQLMAAKISSQLESVNFPLLIGGFLFYFVGGYLLYGAMFAAVGAASDNETDTQQFMLPVTIPLIMGFVMGAAILKDPNAPMAFWFSIIPFTSPTVMLMRLPFNPPAWEIALSMVLLVLGFLFMTWLAGRIYRIGILMYGSKVNYKTLGKWIMMR